MASAEIGHDSLVDFASEKTFQAPDDLPFGSAVRRAACDVINGRLMVPHADDDGSIEGGVGVSMAASIEAVPAGGHPGRGRDRTRAAELREGGFRTNPVGIIAEDDQQFGRSVFIAVVRAFTAVSRVIFSWRIISTAPSAVLGMAVD